MHLPECYRLRADYSFSPDETLDLDEYPEIAETVAGIATDTFSVKHISSGNKQDLSMSQPILGIHLNREANYIQLTAYSCSDRRDILLEEAIMMPSILHRAFANKKGILIDRLAQSRKRLEQNGDTVRDVSLSDLYQIHIVGQADSYYLHSHGLVKFACPDCEWHVLKTIDLSMISSVFAHFIEYLIKDETGLLEDFVVAWQDQEFQCNLENLDVQDKEHYGHNKVVRISGNTVPESLKPRVDRPRTDREAYFYGR